MNSRTYQDIEKEHGKPLQDILIESYERHGSKRAVQRAVAQDLGVSQSTVSLWLKWLNLTQHTVLRPADDPHQKVL